MFLGGVVVAVDRDRPSDSYIDVVQYICPDVDDADVHSHFEGLEIALNDLNIVHVPHFEIWCRTHKTASDASKLLLKGSVFVRYLSELRKVSLCLGSSGGWAEIPPDEILSVPTHFTLGDITIPLDTTQCAEWLLPEDHDLSADSRRSWRDRWRDRCLQDLLEGVRVATAVAGADSELATPALPEIGAGLSARTEEAAECGKQMNTEGEKMEADEADPEGKGLDVTDPRDAEEDEAGAAAGCVQYDGADARKDEKRPGMGRGALDGEKQETKINRRVQRGRDGMDRVAVGRGA